MKKLLRQYRIIQACGLRGVVLCLLIAIALAAGCSACSQPRSPLQAAQPDTEHGLTAHFIDVGQGDSILLESEGEYALIDAGEFECGQRVLTYLAAVGAESLRYVIATHPHSDHIGGMRTVIDETKTENFITVKTDSDNYGWNKLLEDVEMLEINYIDARAGDTYDLGSSTFTIMGPLSDDYEDYNGYSIVIKATCGDISYLLTGDSNIANEKEMLEAGEDLSADVLKCGHHGSSDSTCTRFLQVVNPAFAVISCAKDNEYGHPHRETLERLELLGCRYYCTADSGSVVASTDGKALTIRYVDSEAEPSGYIAGEPKNADSQLVFVGNQKSMLFHDPVCEGAKSMKEENKVEFKTYEEAVAAGYKPCASCDP